MWQLLHARAKSGKTTISDLVRQALSDHYLGSHEQRKQAMQDFVGVCRDIPEPQDAVAYIQSLRENDRMERLHNE
jgi:hypothetical protein